MAKKGCTPWNKGKKLHYTPMGMLGKKVSSSSRKKISVGLKKAYAEGIREPVMMNGKDNPEWKGNKVGYRALHHWVKRHKGLPDTCEYCTKSGLTGHKIHWANIDGKYRRVLEDWVRLCARCHCHHDRGMINILDS